MARGRITVGTDGFADALSGLLAEWSEDVTEGLREAVTKTADEMVEETTASAKGFGWTYYADAHAHKITEDSQFKRIETWYVEPPHYRLAHLLEKGHALHQGGRARAFPHIKPAAKNAEKNLVEKVKKVVADANG